MGNHSRPCGITFGEKSSRSCFFWLAIKGSEGGPTRVLSTAGKVLSHQRAYLTSRLEGQTLDQRSSSSSNEYHGAAQEAVTLATQLIDRRSIERFFISDRPPTKPRFTAKSGTTQLELPTHPLVISHRIHLLVGIHTLLASEL